MRFSSVVALAALSLPASVAAKDPEAQKPCVAKSSTGSYFDLSSLMLQPIGPDDKEDEKHRKSSWYARGYDYGANFTLNLCAPVVEDLEDVQGLSPRNVKNVSAFYKKHDKIFSLGSSAQVPFFRGKKLVLNFTGGSLCPEPHAKRSVDLDVRRIGNPDKEEDDKKGDKNHKNEDDNEGDGEGDRDDKNKKHERRMSATISFLCNHDPTAPKLAFNFVDAPDDCAYFFEARTAMACEGANSDAGEGGGIGPGGVFGLIVLITLAAYILGGIAYQRTVMQQRGWKQLPNYGLWASIWSFIRDFTIIIFSSCARLLPARKGYNQLPTYSDRSRFRRNEDENRLIDQLDEEWDD